MMNISLPATYRFYRACSFLPGILLLGVFIPASNCCDGGGAIQSACILGALLLSLLLIPIGFVLRKAFQKRGWITGSIERAMIFHAVIAGLIGVLAIIIAFALMTQ